MNRNKVITISALAVCCLLLAGVIYLATNKTQSKQPEQKTAQKVKTQDQNAYAKNVEQGQVVQEDQIWEEKASTGDIKIGFHGKVIDDNNNPVDGAFIHAHIIPAEQNKETEKLLIKTDHNGLFNLSATGQTIDIKTIRKLGYKFSKDKNKRLFQSGDINPEELTIFYLEKSDGPTIVQSLNTFVFWKSKVSEYKLDLTDASFPSLPVKKKNPKPELNSWKVSIGTEEKNDAELEKQNDLSFKAGLSDDGTSYNLQISALDKEGGIIVSDELLKEAPEAGYENQTTVKIDISRGVNREDKFLYVRSRNGQVYSRIRLDIKAFPENMHVLASSLTNLEGSRIFEIPFKGRLELEQEIKRQKTRHKPHIIRRRNHTSNR